MTPDKPYLIDAIAGNSRFLASLGSTGRLFRLWWPHIDLPQHVDRIRSGLHMEGVYAAGQTSWFDESQDGWRHSAGYIAGTNVFRTEAANDRLPIVAETLDYAVPGDHIFVREYSFTNRGSEPAAFQFMFYSSFQITENRLYNSVLFDEEADALVHFRHRYCFSVGSPAVCAGFQAGYAWDAAQQGVLRGEQINMTSDGALSWRVKSLQPGETVKIPVYIAAGEDRFASLETLRRAKSRPVEEWFEETCDYWHGFVRDAAPCPATEPGIKELYERSLLMFKLMADEQTGSIVAAPELDETFSRCGGYAYCWGRDAAFITTALDKAGLEPLAARFYDWALTAQDPDGSWQQRHYHDGSLAPSWGIQLDEGASILWGMWEHYKHTEDKAFASRVWGSVSKGAAYLVKQLNPVTGLPRSSRDLWEEREAEHTYTAAAVFGGLKAAAAFARLHNHVDLAGAWCAAAERVADGIGEHCWNEDKSSYSRAMWLTVPSYMYEQATGQGMTGYTRTSAKGYISYHLQYDATADISLLGISVPFSVVPASNERMARTADTIERLLTVPDVGGIKRYEDDTYAGGNPWILTTLWLAQYRAASGQYEEAKRLLRWALDHRTNAGLLPEQVDKHTGTTAWVVPLTWSHAMFVLTVLMLSEHGQL